MKKIKIKNKLMTKSKTRKINYKKIA